MHLGFNNQGQVYSMGGQALEETTEERDRDRNIFLRLYQQYVRPHLEFASPAWSPWTEADKAVLEKIQRRAVGMVSGLKRQSYEEKLLELNLPSLEEKRYQGRYFQDPYFFITDPDPGFKKQCCGSGCGSGSRLA